MTEPALPIPAPPRRRRWRTWLLVLLIFVGGAAVGAGVTVIVAVRSIQHALQHPEQAPQRITARLTRRLDLDRSQARSIEAIIARHQLRLQQIRRETQPRVETELASLETEIAATLEPEQRDRWRRTMATFRENWIPAVVGNGEPPNNTDEHR